MNQLKSHSKFSHKQRIGILLLVTLIILVQILYYVLNQSSPKVNEDVKVLELYQSEVDSLKQVAVENNKPKIYPFNPNFITDYKGYTLGMSNIEIDRLLSFRAKDQWINSAKQFQQVTKVSDSLLNSISIYFKFPEWVTNPKPQNSYNNTFNNLPKTYGQKIDLNIATSEQLKRVNGIGEKLSERIINYRKKLGGFVSNIQLQEVYGLSPEVIERINNAFIVKTPKKITIINLNTATTEELVRIPNIDYEIAHYIIEQRTLREGFKSLDELTKVKDFPIQKIEIIKLYLQL
ncbi:helix-hairpin-helix domain-containing protein [Ichthyenterobacterium sp. W332]|uniref:Helix-hairpin-helix domain-containing protein n=1 Tax=Microcosmobacter mediterraneus TaxID=3075607 RepID=A0ABU2YN35_9FLAO|nr:helix-hairpin-helix domain-containing protein [Ichthyenterobacterium sp. W332]MDT0559579.1 helix-hairpin-helix domain-containing protein [Ichthyenterobacterium sp. W332]